MSNEPFRNKTALIVGGGPAGLFAGELISRAGFGVVIADRMPSVGRKFLVAGKGGLNLTHSEDLARFVTRYATSDPLPETQNSGNSRSGSSEHWSTMLNDFSPDSLRKWALGLDIPTFIGTSGRVFPETKKAAPLLRGWIERLREQKVTFLVRHEFQDWEMGEPIHAKFTTRDGAQVLPCDVLILAMGGASWPQTGSNAAWVESLKHKLAIAPFKSANCGYECDWPGDFGERFGGTPIKNIVAEVGGTSVAGELMMTRYGLEGSALYALGDRLRKLAKSGEKLELWINLKPGFSIESLVKKLEALGKAKGAELADLAVKAWRLGKGAELLFRSKLPAETSPEILASLVTRFPIQFTGPRPIAEAISSSGGVAWSEVTESLELVRYPGVFCAGEMLDWDAPTGGYLIQGCFTTAFRVAKSALARMEQSL